MRPFREEEMKMGGRLRPRGSASSAPRGAASWLLAVYEGQHVISTSTCWSFAAHSAYAILSELCARGFRGRVEWQGGATYEFKFIRNKTAGFGTAVVEVKANLEALSKCSGIVPRIQVLPSSKHYVLMGPEKGSQPVHFLRYWTLCTVRRD